MVPIPIITSAAPADPPSPARTVTVSVAELSKIHDGIDSAIAHLLDAEPRDLRWAAVHLGEAFSRVRSLLPPPAATP